MSEKKEKETVSSKLNDFLEANRKVVLGVFLAVVVVLVAFIAVEVVNSSSSKKNLSAVEVIAYELTDNIADLDEAAIAARTDEYLGKLAAYTSKGGVAGVRANMLAAELAYSKKDYDAAIGYWDAAIAKGKKSYTAPLASFNKAVCYEELNKLDEASAAYKYAADFADFAMATHAKYNYARVFELKGDFKAAADAYNELVSSSSDVWSNLAKTRVIALQAEGKAE